jgi:hypothetical protein
MTVAYKRVKKLFRPQGFVTRLKWKHAILLVRQNVSDARLYEHLDIRFGGKRQEVAYAYTYASVTQWIGIKGLSEGDTLIDVAENKERHWTVVESLDQAKAWEKLLAELAPAALSKLCEEIGQELLTRTQQARYRAAAHLTRIDPSRTFGEQLVAMERSVDARLLARANRVADWAGVVQVYDTIDIYRLASLLVLTGDEEASFINEDPLRCDPLMWQLQLVADGLLSQYNVIDEDGVVTIVA